METIEERYEVVSDGRESSVFDHREKRDLFPTKSGNRDYQCEMARPEDVEHIARCLNLWQQVHGDYRQHDSRVGSPVNGGSSLTQPL